MSIRAYEDEFALVKSPNPIVNKINHAKWYFPCSCSTDEFANVRWIRTESK